MAQRIGLQASFLVVIIVVTACSGDDWQAPADQGVTAEAAVGDSAPVPGDGAPLPGDGPPLPADAAVPPVDSGGSPADSAGPPPPDAAPPAPDVGGVAILGNWVSVTAGSFTMGSPTSEPCREADETAHQVKLTHSFVMAELEVTQQQFSSLMLYNPSHHASCGGDCPVEWVSWHEAAAYCNALSKAAGKPTCYTCSGSGPPVSCSPVSTSIQTCQGYRLPTEAEWEYAARGGTTSAFYNGPISSCMGTDTKAGSIAWYKVNSGGETHPTGKKSPNPLGLYDMAGNVHEWVNDWYTAQLGPATDPVGPATGIERVFRGGAYYFNAEHARSAARERFSPGKRFTFVGFRCVMTQ